MNKENTNTATDILNNPLAGYKNVTARRWGDVVRSREGLWQVCRLLDMCSTFVSSCHI